MSIVGGIKGDTRSLDYSTCRYTVGFLPLWKDRQCFVCRKIPKDHCPGENQFSVSNLICIVLLLAKQEL